MTKPTKPRRKRVVSQGWVLLDVDTNRLAEQVTLSPWIAERWEGRIMTGDVVPCIITYTPPPRGKGKRS